MYFTENTEAIWACSFKIRAKIEIQQQFSVRLTSQTSLLVSCYVARYVSPKCVSVWLFTVETFFFSWNLAWNSFYAVENRNFVSYPIKFPADRSKFQFCTTARSNLIIIFTRTVLPCLLLFSKSSGRNNAKYAFQYTFKCYVAMLYMNYPQCGDWAFSASFVRECTDVS